MFSDGGPQLLGKGGEVGGAAVGAEVAGQGAEEGKMQLGALGGDDEQGNEGGSLTVPFRAVGAGGKADERGGEPFQARMGDGEAATEVGAFFLLARQCGSADAFGIVSARQGCRQRADDLGSAHPAAETGEKGDACLLYILEHLRAAR